jgi:hypothetical protein
MAAHTVTLTNDEELAFAAKVAWINAQAGIVPPVFPPVVPVADVTALLQSYLVPIITMEMDWYAAQ